LMRVDSQVFALRCPRFSLRHACSPWSQIKTHFLIISNRKF
jgi:hypothetical protein